MNEEVQSALDEVNTKIKELRLDVADEIAELRTKLDYDGDGQVEVEDLTKWAAANPFKAVGIAVAVMVVLAILL
jgi:ElaB/YqjD/DUF883 family membrane-anchored ribosome-binding protein